MSLSSAAVAQAAALPLPALLPPPVLAHCSVVIVAAGGRDLVWPQERIAAALLQRSGGRPVHLLLHGGARGADRAIGRAGSGQRWADRRLVLPPPPLLPRLRVAPRARPRRHRHQPRPTSARCPSMPRRSSTSTSPCGPCPGHCWRASPGPSANASRCPRPQPPSPIGSTRSATTTGLRPSWCRTGRCAQRISLRRAATESLAPKHIPR